MCAQQRKDMALFALPQDLLPFLFSFLSPKELCCLDSAILNHTDRPLFLSALIRRFKNISEILGLRSNSSLSLKARWYLCRSIPVLNLILYEVPCPKGMISRNVTYLREIAFSQTNLEEEDALALDQCSSLKKLKLTGCSFPPNFDISSIFTNITNLEELVLSHVPFATPTDQQCRSLKSIHLSFVKPFGDDELRILVEGCPSLCSLSLSFLDNITEKSVMMLRNHRPRISSMSLLYCDGLTLGSVLLLLRETTIPTIFNNEDEELWTHALRDLSSSIPYSSSTEEEIFVTDLLTHESLLERLVELFSIRNRSRSPLISLFECVAEDGFPHLVEDSQVVPVMLDHLNSFDNTEILSAFLFLETLSSNTNSQHHLLTSGVLSIFRPQKLHLLKVRSLLE
jgi:hypothetical protein